MRAGLIQITAGDLPEENVGPTEALIRQAAAAGAGFVLTPEVTNIVSASRRHQRAHLRIEAEDPTLARLREVAAECGVWLLVGSLALKAEGDAEDRFVNRSVLVGPDGAIAARYDKIHMFDVDIDENESFRESAAFRPGDRAVLAETPFARIGLSVCYDIRFPHLYRALAQAGAEVLTIPAAFSPVTGAAHWEVLARARAIETGCFVLAPAQTGTHPTTTGRTRRTHGHSLAVAPWGEVLADAGTHPGITLVDLDLGQVARARGRVPSLSHDRPFAGPA